MSTEIKLTVGIIILSIIIVFVGIKLAYKNPVNSGLALGNPELIQNASNPRIVGTSTKIEIVEFSDFECPSCAAMHPIIKQLLAEEGDKVTFIYRNFPIHAESDKIASLALAAGKQNKFFEMHDLIFEKQSEWAQLPNFAQRLGLFDTYAKSLGLDVNKLHKDMVDKSITDIVAKDTSDARALGINSTPTLIINGKTVIKRVVPYAEFKKAVDAEIASLQ